MLVALDANIWISERMLRSALGAALLYALHQTQGKILLPDTIEKEVIAGISRTGCEAAAQLQQNFVTIQTLIGIRPNYTPPSAKDFEDRAGKRFVDLKGFLRKIECNINHYQLAIDRVVSKRPPNATREQYRDSLLWEVIVEHAKAEEIFFITNDADFFQDKTFSKGLHRNLEAELRDQEANVLTYQNLSDFLKKINESIAYHNYDKISASIHEEIIEEVKSYYAPREWRVGELKHHKINAFLTEDKTKLALSFTLTYSIYDVAQPNKEVILEAELRATGNSFYSITEKGILNAILDQLSCYTLENEKIEEIEYVSSRTPDLYIPYKLRRKLEPW